MTQIQTTQGGPFKDVHLRMSEERVSKFIMSLKGKTEPQKITMLLNTGKNVSVKIYGARTSEVQWSL